MTLTQDPGSGRGASRGARPRCRSLGRAVAGLVCLAALALVPVGLAAAQGSEGTSSVTTSVYGSGAPLPGCTNVPATPAPAIGGTGPNVACIQPNNGPAGTLVVLWGSGLTTAQAVYFGSTLGTSLQILSDEEVMVTAPAGSGTVPVTAVTAHGTSTVTSQDQYTYTSKPTPPALPPVTSAGGAFRLSLPAGTTSSPTLSKSCVTPANLPAHMAAVSCLYNLSGPALSPPSALTLHYKPSALAGFSPDRLCVYALGGAAGWTAVPSKVNPDEGSVTATASGPEVLVLLLNQQRFPDLAGAGWAAPSIDALLAAGVVGGFPDGTFQPSAPLTRAQFVKMLVLAKGLTPGTGQVSFSDVPAGAWYAPYVSAAVAANLVRGLTPTTFGPNAPVTREQMAVLLARAMGLKGSGTLAFTDSAQIASWALPSVEAAVGAGYLNGFPNGTFQPLAPTTRAQAAVVLAEVIAAEA